MEGVIGGMKGVIGEFRGLISFVCHTKRQDIAAKHKKGDRN